MELGRIEMRGLAAGRSEVQELLDRGAALRRADHCTVERPGLGQFVGHREAAGARLVRRHHNRVPGNVLAEIAGDKARIFVIAAAGTRADENLDLLALIEIRDGLRRGSAGNRIDRSQRRGADDHASEHRGLPDC
jgi:hypothetical protein